MNQTYNQTLRVQHPKSHFNVYGYSIINNNLVYQKVIKLLPTPNIWIASIFTSVNRMSMCPIQGLRIIESIKLTKPKKKTYHPGRLPPPKENPTKSQDDAQCSSRKPKPPR